MVGVGVAEVPWLWRSRCTDDDVENGGGGAYVREVTVDSGGSIGGLSRGRLVELNVAWILTCSKMYLIMHNFGSGIQVWKAV